MAHSAGSQRGREGGRSLFPVLQEVTLLLLKSRCILGNPGLPKRESHAYTQIVCQLCRNPYDKVIGCEEEEEEEEMQQNRQGQLLRWTWKAMTRSKKGVASESCCQERQPNMYGDSYGQCCVSVKEGK